MTVNVSLLSGHRPASAKASTTNVAEDARVNSQKCRTTGVIAMSRTRAPKPSLPYCVCRPSHQVRAIASQPIPRSGQNPKILWVDDAEIIRDRIAKIWPAFGDFFP